MQLEDLETGMPLLHLHTDAMIPESISHHHLYVFFLQRHGQSHLCSTKRTMTLGCWAQPDLTGDSPQAHTMDTHHCHGKLGFLNALLSLIFVLFGAPGSRRERCWWTDLASPFKQILSPQCRPSLDLSVWRGPLCQEAFYAGCPRWLQSGRALPGGWQ